MDEFGVFDGFGGPGGNRDFGVVIDVVIDIVTIIFPRFI